MQSQIRKYFAGKTVFLTGATGSLGKLIVEKLSRTCCDVNRIWVLVREKKGVEPAERLRKIFSEPAFGPLKTQKPDFLTKISMFAGNCERPNLGLSPQDLDVVRNDVNVIIHCAATVRFTENLRKVTDANVRPVRDLIEIAKEMKHLDSFVHVSTAYAHCVRNDIDEVYYEPTLTGDKLFNLMDALDDSVLDHITPTILGDWPNTYTFSKAIAEDIIRDEGKSLPISIVRPSIITPSLREPLPGWVDNVLTSNRVMVSSLAGLLRVIHLNPAKIADLIPNDYVANAVIAAAWETGEKYGNTASTTPTIYNCVSGCQNPITWGDVGNFFNKYAAKEPYSLAKWHFMYVQIFNKHLFQLAEFLLHTVPAHAVDFYLYCTGRKPTFSKIYENISKYSEIIKYFMTNEWHYRNENLQNLWKRMGPTDKSLFEFDVKLIDWNKYFADYVRGLRVYVLRDPLETLPKARRRAFVHKLAHRGLVSLVLFPFLFLFYEITSFLIHL